MSADQVLHVITQAMILVLGIAARWITGYGTWRTVRLALWISVVNLPAWFYFSYETGSWSLAGLNLVYAGFYARALFNTPRA